MNYLLLYKPGGLTPSMIRRATKAGYCCIETEDFESVKIMDPAIPANKDELFKAAMFAIHTSSSTGTKTIFGEKIAEVLSK